MNNFKDTSEAIIIDLMDLMLHRVETALNELSMTTATKKHESTHNDDDNDEPKSKKLKLEATVRPPTNGHGHANFSRTINQNGSGGGTSSGGLLYDFKQQHDSYHEILHRDSFVQDVKCLELIESREYSTKWLTLCRDCVAHRNEKLNDQNSVCRFIGWRK
jgi:hypothetical protein